MDSQWYPPAICCRKHGWSVITAPVYIQLDVISLLPLERLLLPFWLCLSAITQHHASASTSYAKKVCSLCSFIHLAQPENRACVLATNQTVAEVCATSSVSPSQMLTVHLSACRIGRLQVNLLSRLVDMLLLCSMAYVPPSPDWHREILVGLHLTRTAFANCGRPLMKSLMMDNVPSRHRGKFNALDSVRTFSWSGSAAAGG